MFQRETVPKLGISNPQGLPPTFNATVCVCVFQEWNVNIDICGVVVYHLYICVHTRVCSVEC